MDKGRKKARIELRPGDWLVLYSDGVTDAFNETGEQYGEGRLVRHLNRSAVHLETSGMIDHLVQDLERHMGNAPQSDDISLIVLKRQPEIQRPGRPEKANATSGGPEMHRTPLEDKACS
jgi:serine/threonine protein phosphatase PrpC